MYVSTSALIWQKVSKVIPSQHLLVQSVSRPISSANYNAADQAIAMDSYQSYFRKIYFFSGKQQDKIWDDPTNLLFSSLTYLQSGNDLQCSCIIFDIFNDSTFFGAIEKTSEK